MYFNPENEQVVVCDYVNHATLFVLSAADFYQQERTDLPNFTYDPSDAAMVERFNSTLEILVETRSSIISNMQTGYPNFYDIFEQVDSVTIAERAIANTHVPVRDLSKDKAVKDFLSNHKVYVSLTTSPTIISKISRMLETLDLTYVEKVFL